MSRTSGIGWGSIGSTWSACSPATGTSDADTTHYVAIHRLEIRPIDDLMIWPCLRRACTAGPGQGLDFRLVNPVGIWSAARADEDPPHNKMGQVGHLVACTAPGLTDRLRQPAGGRLTEGLKSRYGGGSLGLELSRLAPGFLLRSQLQFRPEPDVLSGPPQPDRCVWEEYSVETDRDRLGQDRTFT